MMGKYKVHRPPLLQDKNGILQGDTQITSEMFADHLANISNTLATNPVFTRYKAIKERERWIWKTREETITMV